jgi:hypothetical protein
MERKKSTTGANDRPKSASIGQTAEGIPDDSGRPVEVDEDEVAGIREKLLGDENTKRASGRPS